MSEKLYPHIKLEYMLKGENFDGSSDLVLAGEQYAKTRQTEEDFETKVQKHKEVTFVTFGRNVLMAQSYAEINHEATLMQEDIESHILELGNIALFAGRQLSGPLPDQE